MVIVEADNQPTLIGVTSFISGLGCGFRPSVFIRVNFYLRWISQVTGIVIQPNFPF